ncbi:MAG: Gfo/Idh/MocA family oxidoreductase [Clostridia bacterium]|nr:Gfo/Idh/MocA family oxidoreductase [Clostridia bacterium]
MELKRMKTAIVGCGMISNIYIKNLVNSFTMIDLVALCDMKPEMAQQKADAYGVKKIMTLDEVLASDEIELVINLTAPAAHYDVIKQALEAGKHVYTEKMLCPDLAQGKELIALANEKGLYLGVAPDTFLGAGLQTARKIIDCGLIGEVTSCFAAVNRNQPIASEKFGFIRFAGGSFPYDVGVYYVTALLSLLGPVKRIAGFARPAKTYQCRNFWDGNAGKSWDLQGNNVVAASLEFESGVMGNMHFNGESISDETPFLTIYGTEGILQLGNPGSFDGKVTLIRKGEGACEVPFTHGYKGYPLYGDPTPFDWGGHRGIGVVEMAYSIREGRKNRASKELGLHTMEVLCGIDIASEENRVYEMTTTFELPRALPSGYIAEEMSGTMRSDSEMSLAL